MKYLSLFIALCTLVALSAPTPTLAGDGTGADPIFEILGQDKPALWSEWNQDQKHAHLKSMGVEPVNGKYRGEAGDLAGYFEYLGVPQPATWASMTFEERQAFAQTAQTPQPARTEKLTAPPTPLPTVPVQETFVAPPEGVTPPVAVPVTTGEGEAGLVAEPLPQAGQTDPAATPEESSTNSNMPYYLILFVGMLIAVLLLLHKRTPKD